MSDPDINFGDGEEKLELAFDDAELPVDGDLPQTSVAEEEARNSGWMPEEDWIAAGKDPARHVDAETFIERGRESPGILRKKLDETTRLIEDMQRDQEADRIRQQQLGYAQLAAELAREKEYALANGDLETVQHIEDADAELQYEQQLLDQQLQPPQYDPAMLSFVEDATQAGWWGRDQEKMDMAIALENVLAPQGYSGPALYTEIGRRLNGSSSARARPMQMVEAAGSTAKSASGMAAQPQEVQAAFKSFWNTFKGDFKDRAAAEKQFLADMKGF